VTDTSEAATLGRRLSAVVKGATLNLLGVLVFVALSATGDGSDDQVVPAASWGVAGNIALTVAAVAWFIRRRQSGERPAARAFAIGASVGLMVTVALGIVVTTMVGAPVVSCGCTPPVRPTP
jgi:hypothetical protein